MFMVQVQLVMNNIIFELLPGHRPGAHDPGGGDDIVHGDVAVVLDVLHLLPVPGGLLQRLDDQGSSRRNHRYLTNSKVNYLQYRSRLC